MIQHLRCDAFYAVAPVLILMLVAVLSVRNVSGSIATDLATQASVYSNIFAAASVTQTASSAGALLTVSGTAFGYRDPVALDPFSLDTPLRGNSAVGELSVAVMVQSLVNQQILPQLDSSIPSRFFPGGLQIMNPSFPGVPLTLRMLLTHTSSLVDTVSIFTSPTSSGGSNAQTSLRTFCEGYFLSSASSGTVTVSTDVWSTGQPGLATTFQYARANVALLSYILEQVILENPTLVSSDQKTVASLLMESVFNALSMSDTFFVLPDGSFPRSSRGFVLYTKRVAAETTSSGALVSTVPLFAAYTADYMIRTSVSDINKLLRALFLDTSSSFSSIGTQLLASLTSVTDTSRAGVISQGFGIVGFDPAVVCAAAVSALNLPAGCSIAASTLYGILSVGTNTAVSSMCTTNIGSSGSSCTTAVFGFNPTSAMTPSSTGYVAHVSAFNDLFIDSAVTQGTTITPSTQSPTALFGFKVFLGAFGASLGVLFMAYISEYILQPVPLIGSVSNRAYPTLDEHVTKGAHLMRQQQRAFDQ